MDTNLKIEPKANTEILNSFNFNTQAVIYGNHFNQLKGTL